MTDQFWLAKLKAGDRVIVEKFREGIYRGNVVECDGENIRIDRFPWARFVRRQTTALNDALFLRQPTPELEAEAERQELVAEILEAEEERLNAMTLEQLRAHRLLCGEPGGGSGDE